MSTYTYRVTVEVEDDLGMATECYNPVYFELCENIEDENGEIVARFLEPHVKAQIIMGERLDYAESLDGIGDYTIDWEEVDN